MDTNVNISEEVAKKQTEKLGYRIHSSKEMEKIVNRSKR